MILSFTKDEIEIITSSLNQRRKVSSDNSDHLKKLDKIESELNSVTCNFNGIQRSIISGCIRVSILYPNEELINKNEYEKLMLRNSAKHELKLIDNANRIIEKLHVNRKEHYQYFSDTLNKIIQIKIMNAIHYSFSDNNKIYKIGVMINKNNGFRFELDSDYPIGNLYKEKIGSYNFHKTGEIDEVLDIFTKYSLKNELSTKSKSLVEILNITKEIQEYNY